jgi:hypothetical protein
MKISAAWEQDDGRAPVTPARVAQYEGSYISSPGKRKFCLHLHFLRDHFFNDPELRVWVEVNV